MYAWLSLTCMSAAEANTQLQTVALKDQIHHLQEQALQLKAVNSGLQQEITSLTEEKTRLEGRVKGRVKLSESEMLGLKSRIKDLQSECAGLEEKLMASKDEHQIVCSITPASDH